MAARDIQIGSVVYSEWGNKEVDFSLNATKEALPAGERQNDAVDERNVGTIYTL
jgi:hypothetical protein